MTRRHANSRVLHFLQQNGEIDVFQVQLAFFGIVLIEIHVILKVVNQDVEANLFDFRSPGCDGL